MHSLSNGTKLRLELLKVFLIQKNKKIKHQQKKVKLIFCFPHSANAQEARALPPNPMSHTSNTFSVACRRHLARSTRNNQVCWKQCKEQSQEKPCTLQAVTHRHFNFHDLWQKRLISPSCERYKCNCTTCFVARLPRLHQSMHFK